MSASTLTQAPAGLLLRRVRDVRAAFAGGWGERADARRLLQDTLETFETTGHADSWLRAAHAGMRDLADLERNRHPVARDARDRLAGNVLRCLSNAEETLL